MSVFHPAAPSPPCRYHCSHHSLRAQLKETSCGHSSPSACSRQEHRGLDVFVAACPASAGLQEERECFMERRGSSAANLKSAACVQVIVRRAAIKAYPEYFLTQFSAPALLLFSSLMCHGAFIRALPYPRSTKVSFGSIYMNTSRMSAGSCPAGSYSSSSPTWIIVGLCNTRRVSTQKRLLVELSTFSSETFWWRASLRPTLG